MKKIFTTVIKIPEVLKLCAMQLLLIFTLCGMAMAHDVPAQVLDTKVTLSLSEVTFEKALRAIESAANIKFVYSESQINPGSKVSVQAIQRSLRDVLNELFTPAGIKYKVHEREHTITLKKVSSSRSSQVFENVNGESNEEVMTITGRVTDGASQVPMAGVNVIIKNTTRGTTTDADGKFSIDAEDSDILIFSFIGYTPQELSVNGRSVIDVLLVEDVQSLKEVVVNAGYYETTKEFQTGNIAKVTSKEIEKQPVSNPLAALQARVPGLEITQATGVPGGNFTVRIRGQNSIANGNEPLYIIDGVPYTSTPMSFDETSNAILPSGTSPLNNINPADIETIEVLKDADATAIYGSRGANGVILITTKKGSVGKTKVDLSVYSGAGKVASKMDLLNTEQYLAMRMEAMKNDNYLPYLENPAYDYIWPDLKTWDQTRYTDWQEELLGGTANTTDAQFSVSGGDRNTQFLAGGGYHSETTVFPGSDSDRRISSHLTMNNTSQNQRFKSSFSVNYSVTSTDLLKENLTIIALNLPPNAPPLYTESGELNWGSNEWTQFLPNPLSHTKKMYEAHTSNLIGNALLSYAILPNLEIKVSGGYTDIGMNAITMTPKSSLAPTLTYAQNESIFSNSSFRNWIVEPQLNWKPKLGEGRFDILVGSTFLDQTREGQAQLAWGFATEALMKNIGASATRTLATNFYSQYRYTAGFGRVNYTLRDKYIINLTGRRDGSSRFGSGKQFANFGAAGVAWLFYKERFFQSHLSFVSFGKLRASYGVTGNDQLGDYQYLDTYTSSRPYQGTVGLAPTRLSNPDFGWEQNTKMEVGTELGFVDNRINASFAYYRNVSSDQLVGFTMPPTTGFNILQGNLPAKIENTGFEAELNTSNIEGHEFVWKTYINLTVPRNKLLEFPNLEGSPGYANTLVVGEPLSIRKVYQYTGVDPQTGIYTFEDVNSDGTFNAADRQTIRFIGQEFYGGVGNTFSFKGFQLDFLFQYVAQSSSNYLATKSIAPGGQTNQPVYVEGRWQNPGDVTSVQKFTTAPAGTAAYSRLMNSTESVSDASFLRLKNLSFSYTLQPGLASKLRSQVRIFVQGQNLFTSSNYKGLDPETRNSSLPPLRVLTAGLHVTL